MSAHIPVSRTMRDRLIRYLRRWRPVSPARERHLHAHPEDLPALLYQIPGGQELLQMPDALPVRQQTSGTRPLALHSLTHMEASSASIEERDTELLPCVSGASPQTTEPVASCVPAPSRRSALIQVTSLYRWSEDRGYRNLSEMISEAILAHQRTHICTPVRILVSPYNFQLAHIWKSCESFRSLLVENPAMTRDSVLCEGPGTQDVRENRHVV